jgi:hypothetical protein
MDIHHLLIEAPHSQKPLMTMGPANGGENAIQHHLRHPFEDMLPGLREDLIDDPPRYEDLLDLKVTLDAPHFLDLGGNIQNLPILKKSLDPVKQGNGDDIELHPHSVAIESMIVRKGRKFFKGFEPNALQGSLMNCPLIIFLDKEAGLPLRRDKEISLLEGSAEIEEINVLDDENKVQTLLRHVPLKLTDSGLNFLRRRETAWAMSLFHLFLS